MSDLETVISLEQRLLEPEVRRSLEELDRLITDDFMEVGASGLVFGKAEVMRDLPIENGIEHQSSNMAARALAENVVQVTYVALKIIDGVVVRRSFRTSIWIRLGEQWQMSFHQGTVLA